MRCCCVVLSIAALLSGTGQLSIAADQEADVDELRLQKLGLKTDGANLLAFFKNRSQVSVPSEKLTALIVQLGDKDPAARGQALGELIGLGPLSLTHLRQAASDPDDVVRASEARRALEALQGEEATDVPAAAARLLVARRPRGTVESLLNYLPYADNLDLLEDIKQALIALASTQEKTEPAFVKALQDEEAIRRATAIEILCADGTAEPREELLKLLEDPKASVRLRAALALSRVKEARAVATLIALLTELPASHARLAEDCLYSLAEDQAPQAVVGEDVESRKKAHEAWADWWRKREGISLLEEFRKRTLTEADRLECLALIEKLGNGKFPVREDASEKLKSKGELVIPLLRQATREHEDLEVRERAEKCLVAIEKTETRLSPVTARLVAFRNPPGTCEVLLNFLPFAEDPVVREEVEQTLVSLAFHDGKASPALLTALNDKLPVRRGAAAKALCRMDQQQLYPEIRKLLNDPDATVRMQTALALANAGQRDAVDAVIRVLGELPSEKTARAEEFLNTLAADTAPEAIPDGDDPATRAKRRDVWAAWWKTHGTKIDLAIVHARALRPRYLGYTLIVGTNHGKVLELGRDGKTRWEIAGLSNPTDALVLSNNRVLILESGTRQLTERNLRGEVLWRHQIDNNIYPTGLQRMRNGNILLVSGPRLMEITRAGKEVFTHNRPAGDILAAEKLKDGSIIFVTSSSQVVQLNGAGREVKTWRVPNPTNWGIHISSNGHVVFPQQYNNRVYEYDAKGQQVWTATIPRPVSASRLANGHTLIASYSPHQIVELDRRGKEVWKATPPVQPMRAYRR